MTCDCLTTFDAKLAEHNTRLQIQLIYSRGPNPSLEARPHIGTEQIEKGRGKKRAMGVAPTFCPFCGERYEPAPAVPGRMPSRRPGKSYFDYAVRVDAAARLAGRGSGGWNASFLEALPLFGLRLVRPDHPAVDITRHVCPPAPFGNEGAWPQDWMIVELDDPSETAGGAVAGAPGNPESDAPAPTAGVSDQAARSDIDARGTNCTGTGGSHDA